MDWWDRGRVAGAAVFAAGIAAPVLWRRASPVTERSADAEPPSIDIVIPAYLEAGTVGPKILECEAAARHYPGVVTVTVVASDFTTAEAARAASSTAKVHEVGRGGKAEAVNVGVLSSSSDICVVTDANCSLEPDNWLSVAVDDLRFVDLVSCHKRESGGGDQMFWLYERLVKSSGRTLKDATAPSATLSVVGEFVAFRREDYRPIPSGMILDDLWLAFDFDKRGLVPGISGTLTSVEPPPAPGEQWERRVRITHGALALALPRIGQLGTTPLGRQFLAHKLYRSTLGNAGFWLAIACTARKRPLTSIPMVALVAYASARYSGRLFPERQLNPVLAPIAMQVVPPRSLTRLLRRGLRARDHSGKWKKVER